MDECFAEAGGIKAGLQRKPPVDGTPHSGFNEPRRWHHRGSGEWMARGQSRRHAEGFQLDAPPQGGLAALSVPSTETIVARATIPMTNRDIPRELTERPIGNGIGAFRALAAAISLALSGCQAPEGAPPPQKAQAQIEPQTIREGDVLKLAFPGTPSLDSTQQVRRDGRISLSIVGELVVTGLTPVELEKELAKVYASQLVSSEVSVTVVSSSFSVFVSGAVIKPGKIQPDHPMTALEAIMEAGGFIADKADMKAVVVIRQENGGTRNYTLNLKEVLDGKSGKSFYLKPSDIIFVPEKFSWF